MHCTCCGKCIACLCFRRDAIQIYSHETMIMGPQSRMLCKVHGPRCQAVRIDPGNVLYWRNAVALMMAGSGCPGTSSSESQSGANQLPILRSVLKLELSESE